MCKLHTSAVKYCHVCSKNANGSFTSNISPVLFYGVAICLSTKLCGRCHSVCISTMLAWMRKDHSNQQNNKTSGAMWFLISSHQT